MTYSVSSVILTATCTGSSKAAVGVRVQPLSPFATLTNSSEPLVTSLTSATSALISIALKISAKATGSRLVNVYAYSVSDGSSADSAGSSVLSGSAAGSSSAGSSAGSACSSAGSSACSSAESACSCSSAGSVSSPCSSAGCSSCSGSSMFTRAKTEKLSDLMRKSLAPRTSKSCGATVSTRTLSGAKSRDSWVVLARASS